MIPSPARWPARTHPRKPIRPRAGSDKFPAGVRPSALMFPLFFFSALSPCAMPSFSRCTVDRASGAQAHPSDQGFGPGSQGAGAIDGCGKITWAGTPGTRSLFAPHRFSITGVPRVKFSPRPLDAKSAIPGVGGPSQPAGPRLVSSQLPLGAPVSAKLERVWSRHLRLFLPARTR